MLIDLFPLFKELLINRHDEDKMINYIQAYGAKGIPILVGMQALQVIVAFFPAAAIQVLAGLCYGTWLGAAICLLGYILGNTLVFVSIRQFKSTLSPYLPKPKEKEQHSGFLKSIDIHNMKNPEFMAFFLYLIPGIPNGILPYVFADSQITFPRYLLSISIASIPSVLLCTLIGKTIATRNYLLTGTLVAVSAIGLLVLFIYKNKLIQLTQVLAKKIHPPLHK